MRTSISFFPNTAKKSAKSGMIPLYLRVIHNGQKAEARLNEEIPDTEFQKWNPILMRLDERDSLLNSKLNAIHNTFDQFKILNGTSLHLFNAGKIRDLLVGNREQVDLNVCVYVDNYYKNTVLPNQHLSTGTRKNYLKALNQLEKFLEYTKRKQYTLKDIDARFAFDFRDFLLAKNPQLKNKGMTEVTASGIIKKFRTIFDRAVSEELMIRNPFKLIKLKTKSPMRHKLAISEIKRVHQCDLSNFPALELYKDIFLFGCFTGLAYSDLMELQHSHLVNISETDVLLRKFRFKSEQPIGQVLVTAAKEIIEKFRVFPETNGTMFVFPRRSLNSLNIYSKIIADKVGIMTKVTTHIARHTFRQLISEAGIEDDGTIKLMMGQSRRGNIDSVYYSVGESKLLTAKVKFESYLNSKLQ